MPYPSISSARLAADQPLDSQLLTDLAAQDAWRYDQATSVSGVQPNFLALQAALTAHTHDGTDAQGQPIPTDGIANGGVNFPEEIPDNAFTNPKFPSTGSERVQGDNFQDGAVTLAKYNLGLGQSTYLEDSQAVSSGTEVTLTHTLNRRPVVANIFGNASHLTGAPQIHIVSTAPDAEGNHTEIVFRRSFTESYNPPTDPFYWRLSLI